LDRTTTLTYTDDWNDGVSRTTYAYPTTVTDAGGYSSTIKYRFDIGANVWARSPTPYGDGNTYGKTTSREYDNAGRLSKEMVDNTGAYTLYSYNSNGNEVTTYTTINHDGTGLPGSGDEVATLSIADGAGRILNTRTENPNSSGGYTGKKFSYDLLGRVTGETVPSEISDSWTPTGDDSAWHWNTREYDWKGRVTRTVPSDSSGSDDKDTVIEYAGCGCAGGQITTIKGPKVTGYNQAGTLETTAKRRMQRAYEDILGRTVKTEVWDFAENSPSTPYSRTETTYNARDQVTSVIEYDIAANKSQTTTTTYDGHGRVSTVHKPEWFDAANSNAATYMTYAYNTDDSVASMTDPRGATTTYTYETVNSQLARPLVTGIAYAAPSPNPSPAVTAAHSVTFEFDRPGTASQCPTAAAPPITNTMSCRGSSGRISTSTRPRLPSQLRVTHSLIHIT
jgi:YD repeat-containing protein